MKEGVFISEYLLNVDMDLYGPYHSQEQAEFAKNILAIKYPELEKECLIVALDSNAETMQVFEPKLLC